MELNLCTRLQPGDIIDVIAPGYVSTEAELRGAIEYLKSHGFVPRVPDDLLSPEYFHSNSDQVRFEHLKTALLAKDSKAIWCLRGGYGSNRLIPLLGKIKKPTRAKLLIGISDITSLHLFLNQKWKWPSLHASLLDRLGAGKVPQEIQEELWDILRGEEKETIFSGLAPLNEKARRVKKIQASVVGGNLTVLQSTLGTSISVKAKGSFLFIEDIGERGYRIDRMLEQMKQAKVFQGCRGLLVGHFIGGEEPGNHTSRCQEALQRFADENLLPVFSQVQAGHDMNQYPLPLGTKAQLSGGNNSWTLKVQTGLK
ncbi:MAG: hypothetical protein BroJett040_21560 [Oligoflexia bacterium]|nr:MAG: hypothetical protein BroJett040_21560 [Oligoflexia bacterium]